MHQRGLRILDCLPESDVALAHADAEALAGDPSLDDLESGAVADKPFRDWRELHEHVAAAGREIVEGVFDLVIGVHSDPRGAVLGNKSVGDRFARVPSLHAYHQAFEVRDPVHVRVSARVDDERLTRNRVRRAEVRDPFAVRSDRGARGDAVVGAIVQPGKDAVEIGTRVANQLPSTAELLGDMPHERDVEALRTGSGRELKRWVRQGRSHPQRGRGPAEANVKQVSREQRQGR